MLTKCWQRQLHGRAWIPKFKTFLFRIKGTFGLNVRNFRTPPWLDSIRKKFLLPLTKEEIRRGERENERDPGVDSKMEGSYLLHVRCYCVWMCDCVCVCLCVSVCRDETRTELYYSMPVSSVPFFPYLHIKGCLESCLCTHYLDVYTILCGGWLRISRTTQTKNRPAP